MLAVCLQAQPQQLPLHKTSAVVADSATGAINGVVFDGECGGLLGYANIVVLGTKLGAMSDSLGRFSIAAVPAGTHIVKARAMAYSPTEIDSVRVLPSHATRVEFAMRRPGREEAGGDPFAVAPNCELHKIPMEIVLLPISYGIMVVTREYESLRTREFPNAEPEVNEGCGLSQGMKWKCWAPRCRKCIAARNRYVGTNLPSHGPQIPANWKTYRVADVSFSAPEALAHHTDTTRCLRTDSLDAGSLTIRTYLGRWDQVPRVRLLHQDRKRLELGPRLELGEIICHVYASIAVDRGDRGVTVVGTFRVLPFGGKTFVIAVSTNADTKVDRAMAVVNSVRFRAE